MSERRSLVHCSIYMSMRSHLLALLVFAVSITTASAQVTSEGIVNTEALEAAGISVKSNKSGLVMLELRDNRYQSLTDFVTQNKQALNLSDLTSFSRERSVETANNSGYVQWQQVVAGTPVFAARLTARSETTGALRSITGRLVPKELFSTLHLAPAASPYSSSEISERAKSALSGTYEHAMDWNATVEGEIWISNNPWSATAELVRAYAIHIAEPGGSRSAKVYVDQQTGKPVFQHDLHSEIDRELYHSSTLTTPVWRETDAFPGNLDAEDQEMITATAEIFNLYNRTFGRQGYDGNNGLMRLVSRRASDCPNASASGNLIFHCSGVITDDVVGHEWTHNYIGRNSGLIYLYESGALNEALADIFGEIVDLLNNRGGDTGDALPRSSCNQTNNVRWQVGEDATAFSGALRDMWIPECRNDPGSRTSASFRCLDSETDNGGVHINSGVVNSAFSLLVDGGTLNGVTVTPIGLTKAAHIFYHANNTYATPVTDFEAFGDMLLQSTEDLYGTNLAALTLIDLPATASGQILTPADRQQVVNALAATGMDDPNACPFTPTLAQNPPAGCEVDAATDGTVLLSEDWEDGMAGWTLSQAPVNPSTWTDQPWLLNDNLPADRPGQSAFIPNQRIGDCQGDLENGTTSIASPTFIIPADGEDVELRFNHYYSTEGRYDGGIVELSRNGGAFTKITNGAFTYNGYDTALRDSRFNDNPLEGERAFHGSDDGRLTGTWGTSVVDLLAAGVVSGDRVSVRWTFGSDGCNGHLGWYLDEVTVTSCRASALPVTWRAIAATPTDKAIEVTWSTTDEIDNAGFTVQRAEAATADFIDLGEVMPSGTVTGDYIYSDDSALPGVEYLYRVRQSDYDGTLSYSPLASATLSGAEAELMAFPNPASRVVNVRVSGGGARVTLNDLAGRELRAVAVRNGRARLDVRDLPSGVYLLRSGVDTKRLVVKAE